jgi:hypothetical protein
VLDLGQHLKFPRHSRKAIERRQNPGFWPRRQNADDALGAGLCKSAYDLRLRSRPIESLSRAPPPVMLGAALRRGVLLDRAHEARRAQCTHP